jgi:ABC-type glycerol-3-phosphate transport system substrate-binding protein
VIEAFQFQLFDSQYRLNISPTAQMIAAQPDAYQLEAATVAMHVRGVDALANTRMDTASPVTLGGQTRLDVQLLPRGRASRTPHVNLVEGQVMTRASKDKEAAWDALKWIGSDAGQMRVAEQGRMCNTVEANRRFWLPLARKRFAVPNVEAFVKAIEGASIDLAGEIGEQTLNRDAGLDAALAAIRDGALKAKDALDLVQPRIQHLLDSYWQIQARAR